MKPEKHIPPDVLMRIGEAYVNFIATIGEMGENGPTEAQTIAAKRLDTVYQARFYDSISPDGEDLPKRYFTVEAGATYTIVAFDHDHAWVLFALEIAKGELGSEYEDVTLKEIDDDRVAAIHVNDERDGREGRYPLTTAEIGAVFCSEY